MRRILFPFLATATLAIAGLDASTLAPANAADLQVTPQPPARVHRDYDRHYEYRDRSADRYYRYQRVDVYDEPAPVYYEERIDYYVPPPVVYGPPVPPEPVVAEYDYAPRGYYRGYASPPRAIEVYDAY
jgi:hypothetical protein